MHVEHILNAVWPAKAVTKISQILAEREELKCEEGFLWKKVKRRAWRWATELQIPVQHDFP